MSWCFQNGIEQVDSNKTTTEPPPTSVDEVKVNLTRDSLLVPSVAPPRPGKNKDVATHRKKAVDSPVTNRKGATKEVVKPAATSAGKDKTKGTPEKMPSLDLPIAKLAASGSPSSARANESEQKRPESNHTTRPSVSPTHSSSNMKQPSTSSLSSVGAPRGSTLADLKRVRAQKLQDSLRFRDTKLLNEQINNHNSTLVEGSTVSNGDEKTNGHNGSLRNSINSNLSAETTEPQKHRFTARASEIVGDDNRNDNSCCTIL